jgi:hypothetical protein
LLSNQLHPATEKDSRRRKTITIWIILPSRTR